MEILFPLMLYIPKINDHSKILTDEEVKEFLPINLSEYLKYAREKLHSNLSEEQNLRKVPKSFYIFLTTPDDIKKNMLRWCN